MIREEMLPRRSWRVRASAEITLTFDRTADVLGRLHAASEVRGGFLCGLSFPPDPRPRE
jgi:hypothetical protein